MNAQNQESTAARLEGLEFNEVRGGLLIPKTNMKGMDPEGFVQFFRDVLSANVKKFDSRAIGFGISLHKHEEELVIPIAASRLAVMRYSYYPGSVLGGTARYSILTTPSSIGHFQSQTEITHSVNHALWITDGQEKYGFSQSVISDKWLSWKHDELGLACDAEPLKEEDCKYLGKLASDFVKLVS